MQSRWLRGVVPMLPALVVLLGLGARAQSAVPFEKALPDDVVAFASVPNVDGLKKALSETQFAQMLHDPAMKPFVDGIKGEVNKLLDMAQQMGGINIPEIVGMPTGQLALAVRLDAKEPASMPYVYFLCDVKGKETQVKALIERLTQVLEDAGYSKSTDGDVTVLSPSEKKPRQVPAIALKGNLLVVGNDPDAIKATVAGLGEGISGKSLADNPRFQSFRQQTGNSDAELFIDLEKAMEVIPSLAGEYASTITQLGLNAFQVAGASLNVGKEDFDHSAKLILQVKGQTPIFNLINMPAKPLKPEAWVPDNVTSYTSFNWDLDLFWSALTNLIKGVNPDGLQQIEAMLAGPDPDNPLLNIKNDLIGPLGNRLSILSDAVEEKGKPSARVLVAWEVQDSAKLNSLIDRVMQLAGGALPLQDKMVKGNKVYFFPLGDLLAAQMPDQNIPVGIGVVGFSITKTHFFLATHVELLDKVLDYEGKPGLAENADYRKVAEKFPSATSLITYTKSEEQARAAFQAVKSGQVSKAMKQALEQQDEVSAFLGGLIDALEGKNLPEFSAVKKYFLPSGAYAVMNEKGIQLTTFTLKK